MHISDYLFRNAKNLPQKPALITTDRTMTWQELAREVNSAAASLEQYLPDDNRQQIVATLVPNSWQCVVVYLAIVHLGHVALPVDISFKKLEVDFVLEATRPDLVIADRRAAALVAGPVILVSDILSAKLLSPKKVYRVPATRQVASLFLSSGTTGKPKPIPNTHANQLWDVRAIAGPFGWTEQDSLLITLHLTHRHGLVICLLSAIYHGNTVYLTERFSIERTVALLESGKISIYSTVPPVYEQLVNFRPKGKINLSKVRLFASSSSPMPPHLAQAFKNRYTQEILDRYGTSEAGSMAVRPSSSKNASSRLVQGVKLRIEPNGEIAVRSPGVFPGYYKNSTATRKNMTADGWWLPGDIGELDGGRLILRGRSKEIIIRSGYNVYPLDIEWALKKNSKVAEIKIIATSDQNQLDDKVFAFFSGNITKVQLADYSRLNLPRSWRPDCFIKLKSLPKTTTGKPRVGKLKAMLN